MNYIDSMLEMDKLYKAGLISKYEFDIWLLIMLNYEEEQGS